MSGDRVVVDGAQIKCEHGSTSSSLRACAAVGRRSCESKQMATVLDCLSMIHVLPFGTCSKTGVACVPLTALPWIPDLSTLTVTELVILTESARLYCLLGAWIKVIDPGQSAFRLGAEAKNDSEPGLSPSLKEMVGFDKEWHNMNDSMIAKVVGEFNATHDPDIDANLVKAWALTESGGHQDIFESGDMMQVNNPGDWTDDKIQHAGIQKDMKMTPETSLKAALNYAYWKGSIHDAQGNVTGFRGWDTAIERYNGGGDPEYTKKIRDKLGR